MSTLLAAEVPVGLLGTEFVSIIASYLQSHLERQGGLLGFGKAVESFSKIYL